MIETGVMLRAIGFSNEMIPRFVSAEAFADTYDPDTGWQTVQQYREATRLRSEHPDLARAEIARRVGRSPSAVRGWLAEGKTPAPVKALETAQDHGWINIEPTSEVFRALNQLVAWIFAGGSIRRDRFVPVFSVDDQLTLTTLNRLLTWVDVSYRVREDDRSDQGLEVIPSDSSTALGRVLHILGAPLGDKTTNKELTFPRYLDTVDREHRRDFARIYLLNRGAGIDTEPGDGTYLPESRSTAYTESLQDFFSSVTTGSVTLASQNRIWVSAESVQDLAESTPLRSALATQAAYGSLTPPTERALASTYRRGKQPDGYRYAQLYQQVVSTDNDCDALIGQYSDLTEQTIKQWQRGHVPPSHTALVTAREHGWLAPPTETDVALALTAFVAWIFARGTLRTNSFHPVFRLGSSEHRDRFNTIADDFGLSYSFARETDSDRTTEIHPSENGSLLGRILFALGVPMSKSSATCLPPVYLYYSSKHAHRFVSIWCMHHTTIRSDEILINIPSFIGTRFRDGFAALLETQFSWRPVRVSNGLVVDTTSNDIQSVL